MAINFKDAVDRGTEDGIEWALKKAPVQNAVNGYAKLPDGHPWRELDLMIGDCERVNVHGGITYGPDKDGWIGFDTVHAWDVWPGKKHMFDSDAHDPMNIYWDQQMVKDETVLLARQVAEAAK